MSIQPNTVQTKPKKKKKWKIASLILGILILLWIIIYLFPVSKTAELHAFEKDRPLVIAHQGGEDLAPSSTLPAFQNAFELGVDVLEFDVHITSDGHLVAIHDATVDRTTNGNGTVNDMTLAEVQALDAGYYFQDLQGEYSFRNQGVYIPTVEEIFQTIPDPEMLWIIEIKDSNKPELYQTIAEKLWEMVQAYGLEKRTILASFDQNIVDMILEVSEGGAIVSGGRKEVTEFVVFHKLFLNGLYQPKVDALHIPINEGQINLTDKNLIHGAHKRGMDVHYWTINDKETMKKLLDLGADGIMTDRPDLLLEVMKE